MLVKVLISAEKKHMFFLLSAVLEAGDSFATPLIKQATAEALSPTKLSTITVSSNYGLMRERLLPESSF